jgi:hypothetical protein
MDRHFLEFWGKFLLNAAKSQKQLEDLTKWLQSGCGNWQDFTALFQQAYGLEQVEQDRPDYLKLWEQAEENFRESCREYLNLLGGVANLEFQELIRKQGEQFQELLKGMAESMKADQEEN